jgi:3-methyl-2-oxobutanoate hydroxymethyltransferase
MITIRDLRNKKIAAQPIVMLTAYDYPMARLVAASGVDMILVGDSGGMTQLGYKNTLPVTMDEMVAMVRAVRRGAPDTFLIGDMPFMSYQASVSEAVANAGRLIKEGGADAIKLEGGRRSAATVRAIVDAGIAVQGHVGLTPQNATQLSGYRVQGRDEATARQFVDDCLELQEAGAFSLIFECVPHRLATVMTRRLDIPTIGTGSGVGCSGQNLITPDVLGLCELVNPRYVKRYADLPSIIGEALAAYVADVSSRSFPGPEHGYEASGEWFDALLAELGAEEGADAAP